MVPIIASLVLAALVALAVRTFMRRAAATRAAHDARLAAMAQVHLAAARKKKAAEAAAARAAAAQPLETPATPAVAAPARDERDCPFCAEPILKKAKICKHCGRDVVPLA